MTNGRKLPEISRRRFIGGAALAGAAFTIAPRDVLGGPGYTPPSERINLASIGVGGRGKRVTEAFLGMDDVRVSAICDVTGRNDYSRFYYRKEAGREVVAKVINDRYAGNAATSAYAPVAEYIDFRKLLEKEKGIDAVMIATPDHMHATAALAAIGHGKHVYCEKPLTRTVYEARKVAAAARQAKVMTQMGQQGHSSEGIRSCCEWVWDGAIGAVREVYAWSDTGGWANPFTARPKETPPVPADLDWDLWLGPVPHRPYHPMYTPYNWRGWWQFGTGAIGDMACHNMDPAFWALKLGHPSSIEARCSTQLNSETTPKGCTVRYEFPARGEMPPVKLTWFDGGLRPPRPPEMNPSEKFDGNGLILRGDKGTILCGGWSRDPRLLPKSRMDAYKKPPKTLPRSQGHQRDFALACKGGPVPSSHFDYSAHLTEVVLLGNVALRTGKKLDWDGETMRARNAPEAEQFLKPQFREGWEI